MSGLTRGPLGAEVYWRRRVVVIGVALLLVLGISRFLGQGSDASDGAGGGASSPGTAVQAGVETSSSPPGSPSPATPTPSTEAEVRKAERQQRRAEKAAARAEAEAAAASAAAAATAALPEPQGPCSDTDVVVTPSIASPVAGSDVVLDLDLRTRFSPACTWSVSADTVALKITSGPDDIWSSQDCPAAIPAQQVTLRRAVPTVVQVTWNARRSDAECSGRTDWALPGFYHVLAAALAGEPTDVQFEMTAPAAPQVTRTAEPEAPAGGKKKARQG